MNDTLLTDDSSQSKQQLVAIIILAAMVLMGCFFLLYYRSYLDAGHILVMVVYFLVSCLIYAQVKNARFIRTVFLLFIGLVTISVGVTKAVWNEKYIQQLGSRDGFLFDEYIDRYPSWEEYTFSKLLNSPDWVRFTRECARPALSGKPVQPYCRNKQTIKRAYRIDINQEIYKMFTRMQRTARMVVDGRMTRSSAYHSCIARKECGPIPLLPPDVEPDSITPESPDHLDIRKTFWQLINEESMTIEICQAMLLCRAMYGAGAVTNKDFNQ